jgi:DNA-binding Lrp family transcriptional regulator
MAMEDWWSEIDDGVRACLERHGAMSPREIAQHLGLSEAAVSSAVSLLAQEGKLRIARVELFDHPSGA